MKASILGLSAVIALGCVTQISVAITKLLLASPDRVGKFDSTLVAVSSLIGHSCNILWFAPTVLPWAAAAILLATALTYKALTGVMDSKAAYGRCRACVAIGVLVAVTIGAAEWLDMDSPTEIGVKHARGERFRTDDIFAFDRDNMASAIYESRYVFVSLSSALNQRRGDQVADSIISRIFRVDVGILQLSPKKDQKQPIEYQVRRLALDKLASLPGHKLLGSLTTYSAEDLLGKGVSSSKELSDARAAIVAIKNDVMNEFFGRFVVLARKLTSSEELSEGFEENLQEFICHAALLRARYMTCRTNAWMKVVNVAATGLAMFLCGLGFALSCVLFSLRLVAGPLASIRGPAGCLVFAIGCASFFPITMSIAQREIDLVCGQDGSYDQEKIAILFFAAALFLATLSASGQGRVIGLLKLALAFIAPSLALGSAISSGEIGLQGLFGSGASPAGVLIATGMTQAIMITVFRAATVKVATGASTSPCAN